jgi:hypothetical protein
MPKVKVDSVEIEVQRGATVPPAREAADETLEAAQ